MPREAVSDTSPLLNLALIDRLDLLEQQFENVKVPEQVWEELEAGEEGMEKLEELKSSGFLEVVPVERDELFQEIMEDIDLGEAAALSCSLRSGTEPVLVDEKEAREVARRHGLETTGVVGILLKAAQNGGIELEKELEGLRSKGFWLSDELVDSILDRL